jgi:hypothetical protein
LGVYNWPGTIGKTTGPDGKCLDVKSAIPDLEWIDEKSLEFIVESSSSEGDVVQMVIPVRSPLGAPALRHPI